MLRNGNLIDLGPMKDSHSPTQDRPTYDQPKLQ